MIFKKQIRNTEKSFFEQSSQIYFADINLTGVLLNSCFSISSES